jgi:hypothetical protein
LEFLKGGRLGAIVEMMDREQINLRHGRLPDDIAKAIIARKYFLVLGIHAGCVNVGMFHKMLDHRPVIGEIIEAYHLISCGYVAPQSYVVAAPIGDLIENTGLSHGLYAHRPEIRESLGVIDLGHRTSPLR